MRAYTPVLAAPDRAYTPVLAAPGTAYTPVLAAPDKAYTPVLAAPDKAYTPVLAAPDRAYTPVLAAPALDRLRAEKHKELGNQYRRLRLYELAVAEYMKGLIADPAYTDAYYNLGKTYLAMGDRPRALTAFQRLLQVTPDDHDARTVLAEQLAKAGDETAALAHYRYITARARNFDPAYRNVRLLENRLLARTQPAEAAQVFAAESQAVLLEAQQMIHGYYAANAKPDLCNLMASLRFVFAPTQEVGQVANMAEYDYKAGIVRITPELAFAHANVLAAYIIHELQHAKDGDGLSSVMEEQDGYRELARFWLATRGTVSEPNLDLAANLYNTSPDMLDAKVRELYVMRDPLIPEKSPGHGLPYNLPEPSLLESYRFEQVAKYSQFVFDRIKSLLPVYGLATG